MAVLRGVLDNGLCLTFGFNAAILIDAWLQLHRDDGVALGGKEVMSKAFISGARDSAAEHRWEEIECNAGSAEASFRC